MSPHSPKLGRLGAKLSSNWLELPQKRGLGWLMVLRRGNRSWRVLLVGVVCTLLAVLFAPPPRGVYWARAEMMFVAPTAAVENPLRGDHESLIYFAAAIEQEFNGQTSYARAASASATLYGRGVRNGYSVTLPSTGGQWQPSFASPNLTIEVVETSEMHAREILEQVVNQLNAITRNRQRATGVPERMMIQTSVTPSEPVIHYITGSYHREQAAIFAVGVAASFALAAASKRRRSIRSPDRSEPAGAVQRWVG